MHEREQIAYLLGQRWMGEDAITNGESG